MHIRRSTLNSTTIKASVGRYSAPINILIRLGWVSVALLSIIYSLKETQYLLLDLSQPISKWIYGYINFGSFVLGLIAASIIFWRKPKDWLAIAVSLMLIMWTSTGDGYYFFSPPAWNITCCINSKLIFLPWLMNYCFQI